MFFTSKYPGNTALVPWCPAARETHQKRPRTGSTHSAIAQANHPPPLDDDAYAPLAQMHHYCLTSSHARLSTSRNCLLLRQTRPRADTRQNDPTARASATQMSISLDSLQLPQLLELAQRRCSQRARAAHRTRWAARRRCAAAVGPYRRGSSRAATRPRRCRARCPRRAVAHSVRGRRARRRGMRHPRGCASVRTCASRHPSERLPARKTCTSCAQRTPPPSRCPACTRRVPGHRTK